MGYSDDEIVFLVAVALFLLAVCAIGTREGEKEAAALPRCVSGAKVKACRD